MFARDKGDDDAYVECPNCGAMAMSVGEATDALARNLSSSHDLAGLQDRTVESPADSDDEEDSGAVNRDPSLVHNFAGAGIFAGLLDAPVKEASPPPVVGGLDLGLDDELGDFELPATAPGNAALSPQKKAPPKKAASPTSSPRSTSPPKRPVPVEQGDDVSVSLGDDALDALGAAFDSMAMRPSQARGADGLSDDERNFLSAEAPAAPEPRAPPRRPPPRPPGKPGERRQPPPPRAKKRERAPSTGIALSAEAKEAAFLPLKTAPAPSAPAVDVDVDVRPRAQRRVEPEHGEATLPGGTTPAANEPTQLLVRPTRGPPPRVKPSVMGGVPVWAMAAAVLLGIVGGGAGGALTAPGAVKRNDARGHAEDKLVEGNRFYADGRYEDAIASYKAALNNDRAFAVAHRAKGAALARKDRYDEAAMAYRDYLALEPSAIDANDIKEALVRRNIAPVAGGEGVR